MDGFLFHHGHRNSARKWILNFLVTITTLMLTTFFPSTEAAENMYVSNATHILKVNLETKAVEVLPMTGSKIVSMTADIARDLLFWSNNGNTSTTIYRSSLNGSDQEVILKDISQCNGLSVDWISKHLYWTDSRRQMIEMSNYDGSGRRIVARARLDKPQGIVVDPIFGYIFWADVGNKKLERARLDGTDRQVIVENRLTLPNQIAISYATRRVYWVDAWSQAVMSCDLNGQNILVERNISFASLGSELFGLVVIGNKAYVSAWAGTAIYSTQVATKNGISLKLASGLGRDKLYSLLSTEKAVQPKSYHPCGQQRAECSHLCLPLGGTTHRCSCPTMGGLALSRNGKTCEVPEQLLFYTMQNSGEVGFVSLDGSRSPDGTIVAFSCHPTAVTYDPVQQFVYWSDTLEKKIYRSKIDGTEKEVFLNSSSGIGLVEGMTFDWLRQRLYFTNSGQSLPRTDGAVYGWQKIEMITVDKTRRMTVVTDVEKPRGLAVDVAQGYLYYTEWGKHPRVISTWLDGSSPNVLLDEDISNPNGLTISQGLVFVADSNYSNRSSEAKLLMYNSSDNSWKTFLAGTVKVPMSIAVRNHHLYYTDWGSTNKDDNIGSILQHDLRSGTSTVRMLTGNKPTGLFYSPRVQEMSVTDPCSDSDCSDLCMPIPPNPITKQKYRCLCGDGDGKVLSADGKTCKVPEKFLLIADLNTIKMTSFDMDFDSRMKTLVRGNLDSNYVALTYHRKTKAVFWSDIASKSIMAASLHNGTVRTVYSGKWAINGLDVDLHHDRLYWTASNNISGHIGRMSIHKGVESYKILIDNLDSPKAIVIHQKKRWVYWTEYGVTSGLPVVKRSKTSGHHQVILMDSGLFWPNALALHRDKLYVADGFYRRIHSMELDGSNQKELVYLSGSMDHVFGLNIRGNALFYTDWFTNGTYMVDMVTGISDTIAKNLYRPTAVITNYPPHKTDAAHCTTGLHNCVSVCVPLPRGYHCTCPVGQQLNKLLHTCESATEPWKVTDSFRCEDRCHKEGVCAQLVPTLHYQCVCKPGFQGDGERCSACRVDTFKASLSNDTCIPCPVRKGTRGSTGAVDCVCKDRQAKPVMGDCILPTSAPVVRTSKTRAPLITLPRNLPPTTSTHKFNQVPVTQPYVTYHRAVYGETQGEITNKYDTRGKGKEFEPEVFSPGLPYFHNCPDGETLELKLPPGSSIVSLPIRWVAKDHRGNQIPFKANYPIKDGFIPLRWMGNRQEGRHILVFEATDTWQQLTTCQFHVVVKDLELPKFSYCPHNIIVETSNVIEKVTWTPPKVTDNVGVQSLMQSHEPGSDFTQGLAKVNYTAVDGAGNVAVCNFTVTIQQEVDCLLPAVDNGAFICGQDPQQLHICHLICEKGFAQSPLKIFNQPYNCLLKDDIDKLKKRLTTQRACLRRRSPSRVRQEFGVTFQGPCNSRNASLIAGLSKAVVDYLASRHFCTKPLCELSNVTIVCGTATHSQAKPANYRHHRHKREVVAFFVVKWNITMEISDELTQTRLDLLMLGLKLKLIQRVSSISLYIGDNNYYSVPGSVVTGPIVLTCQIGEVKVDGSCVRCPEGTMHDITAETCVLCPRGTYQDVGGHSQCKRCREGGATKEQGTLSASQCLSTSSIDEMSKFLIIAACCFGFLFLSIVLFMYYHFNKQKTSNGSRSRPPLARTNRLAVSNVYAPSPVLSKPKFLQGDAENRTLGSMTTGSLYSNASLSSRDNFGNKREYVNADFINRDISSLSSHRDYRSMNKHFSSKEFVNVNEYEEVDADQSPRSMDRFSLRTTSSNETVNNRLPENNSLRHIPNNKRPPTGRIKNFSVPMASSDDDDNNVV